jgi:hypothetical protein
VIPPGYRRPGPVMQLSTGYWWNGFGYERTRRDALMDQKWRIRWKDPANWRDLRFVGIAPFTAGVVAALPPAALALVVLGRGRQGPVPRLAGALGLVAAVAAAPVRLAAARAGGGTLPSPLARDGDGGPRAGADGPARRHHGRAGRRDPPDRARPARRGAGPPRLARALPRDGGEADGDRPPPREGGDARSTGRRGHVDHRAARADPGHQPAGAHRARAPRRRPRPRPGPPPGGGRRRRRPAPPGPADRIGPVLRSRRAAHQRGQARTRCGRGVRTCP